MVKENKAQSKQAKHKSVFFWFGDDSAVHADAQALVLRMIGPTLENTVARPVAVVTARACGVKVADGLAHHPQRPPSRRRSAGIGKPISFGDANSKVICATTETVAIFIHPKMGNGSVASADGDRRRVGGTGGKEGVRANTTRNSITHRVDVFDVGIEKQGRKRERLVDGLVGVVKC